MTSRQIALGIHFQRPEAVDAACDFIVRLHEHDVLCWVREPAFEAIRGRVPGEAVRPFSDVPDEEVELVVVFGGDGTILRTAEWAVPEGYPVLGVNLGHVGFLAELEESESHDLVETVVNRDYRVEERLCLEVELRDRPGGEVIWSSFAINEVSLEKAARERMIEVLVDIDGHPLSRWGTDGVLVSTPTGSTAYAFSAQGPVMWPDLEALQVVPLLAHALFARPLVLSPHSVVDIRMLENPPTGGVLWCDGRRSTTVEPLNKVTVRRSEHRLRLARTSEQPFVQRLVRKFELPIHGWRGTAEREAAERKAANVRAEQDAADREAARGGRDAD